MLTHGTDWTHARTDWTHARSVRADRWAALALAKRAGAATRQVCIRCAGRHVRVAASSGGAARGTRAPELMEFAARDASPRVGDAVCLLGLKKADRHNGATGIVVNGVAEEDGRLGVKIRHGEKATTLRVKPENYRVIEAAATYDDRGVERCDVFSQPRRRPRLFHQTPASRDCVAISCARRVRTVHTDTQTRNIVSVGLLRPSARHGKGLKLKRIAGRRRRRREVATRAKQGHN